LAATSQTQWLKRPVRLQAGREKSGEGNPDDPDQARSQMSEHAESGGATVGLAGARSNPHALADMT